MYWLVLLAIAYFLGLCWVAVFYDWMCCGCWFGCEMLCGWRLCVGLALPVLFWVAIVYCDLSVVFMWVLLLACGVVGFTLLLMSFTWVLASCGFAIATYVVFAFELLFADCLCILLVVCALVFDYLWVFCVTDLGGYLVGFSCLVLWMFMC